MASHRRDKRLTMRRRLALAGTGAVVVLALVVVALVVGTGRSAPPAHDRRAPASASTPLAMLPQSQRPEPTMLPQSGSPTPVFAGDRNQGGTPVGKTPSARPSAGPTSSNDYPCDNFQDISCDETYWGTASP